MELRRSVVLLAVIGSLILGGCGNQQQRQFRQEKRQFSIVMRSKLRQFEQRAAQLATQVQGDSLHTAEVTALQGSHVEFRSGVAAIDTASESEWKELKPAMEAAYYDLERRYYEIAGAVAAQAVQEAAVDTLATADEDSTRSVRAR